ncbi:hypothetical protein BRADI_3g48756v3 [Brachypodium distachyon]|uniref:Uncharacterized protein n=1 Tax=Brachypodium distachyon TaxID=15368 RepID=A0A0Q3M7B8_BRADI|nr:hypothetical protein BRADI_3g48756v3 [Brachypodium distachyon]
MDLPAPVTDPLLAWARGAYWTMGGLKAAPIEGNLIKIRRSARRDDGVLAMAKAKSRVAGLKPASLDLLSSDYDAESTEEEEDEHSESGESDGKKKQPTVTLVNKSLKTKVVSVKASVRAAEALAKKSPNRKSAEVVTASRRTSPRSKS